MLFLINLSLVHLWLSNVSRFCVLKGNVFSRENLLDMTYRSEENKVAIVHVKSDTFVLKLKK